MSRGRAGRGHTGPAGQARHAGTRDRDRALTRGHSVISLSSLNSLAQGQGAGQLQCVDMEWNSVVREIELISVVSIVRISLAI